MYDTLEKRYSRRYMLNEGKDVSFKQKDIGYKPAASYAFDGYRSTFRNVDRKPERNKNAED